MSFDMKAANHRAHKRSLESEAEQARRQREEDRENAIAEGRPVKLTVNELREQSKETINDLAKRLGVDDREVLESELEK